ncbi:MAG TPA: PQQ-dependent sugar dehydrogenase, partial [Anaerolineae bacterium]|nr:PQQ-dependent sugar dehydrogenase [Anaerolineae bacterium]
MNRLIALLIAGGLWLTACAQPAAPRVTVSPGQPTSAPTVMPATAPPATTVAPTPTLPPTLANMPDPPLAATPTSPATQPTGSTAIALEPVVSGLKRPDYLTQANDDRLFVVEQPGRIRIVENGQLLDQPFLDIVDRVLSSGNEQGLLSVAFQPDYASTGQFFVNYTRKDDGATIVERYQVSKSDPNVADKSSASEVIVIQQPEANHNGGLIKFGPDGYLYIGMGDGGGAGDPDNNGQSLNTLLGKMLR